MSYLYKAFLPASFLLLHCTSAQAAPLVIWDFEENAIPGEVGRALEALDQSSFDLGGGIGSIFGNRVHRVQRFNGEGEIVEINGSRRLSTTEFGSSLPEFGFSSAVRELKFLESLSFSHFHENLLNPSYNVQLQFSLKNDEYIDVGDPVVISAATNGVTSTIDIGLELPVEPAGKIGAFAYGFRFVPVGLSAADTAGEFFAIDDVVLSGTVPAPAPAALMLLGLAGLAWRKKRAQQGDVVPA